jgi:hypothetical protein
LPEQLDHAIFRIPVSPFKQGGPFLSSPAMTTVDIRFQQLFSLIVLSADSFWPDGGSRSRSCIKQDAHC